MDVPITYNPMGDSEETGVAAFDVSVSFGRFETILLDWDKWSTFPTNKYLEEVEKCSTPGSVAQKKAYFEAHYKKIAARKAEQEEQDKKIGDDGARDPVDSEVQAQRDLVAKFCEAEEEAIESDNEVANSASETSSDKVDEPKDSLDMANESKDLVPPVDAEKLNEQKSAIGMDLENEVTNPVNEMRSDQVDEPKDSLDMANESKDLIPLVDVELNEQKSASGMELENELTNPVNEMRSDQVDEPKNRLDMANESKNLIPLVDAEKLNEQKSASGIVLETEVTNSVNEIRSDQVDEPKSSLAMGDESKDLMPPFDEVKDESCCRLVNSELHESDEVALVKDEAPKPDSRGVEELPQHIDNARDNVSVVKEEKVKSDKILKSKKSTTTKNSTNTTVLKKKPAATAPKSSLLSTPKLSRPALSKSTMSTTPLIKRKPSKTESRRAAPTSLHISLRLGPDCPANSEPAPSTTMRKSVFMEKMGDKDIVKRAFKAFRNDFNQLSSSSPGKPTVASQIPQKESGIKASVVGTPQKKIEGVSNVVKKTQNSQPGLKKTSNSTRLPYAAVSADQRNIKSVSSNYGLRSRDKLDKSKEVSKNLEEKANGEAAERTQRRSKIKKETEIKRLSRDDYTKAKPVEGTAKPKSSLDKKSAKRGL